MRRELRPIKEFENEPQMGMWCGKSALNNLLRQHKFFVGTFWNPLIKQDDQKQNHLNIMAVCRCAMEKYSKVTGAPCTEEAAAENGLCSKDVNVGLTTIQTALELAGFTQTTVMEKPQDWLKRSKGGIEDFVNKIIPPDMVAAADFVGFMVRINLVEKGLYQKAKETGTWKEKLKEEAHWAALRRMELEPGEFSFEYVDERVKMKDQHGPLTQSLPGLGDPTMCVKSFLAQTVGDRLLSLVAVSKGSADRQTWSACSPTPAVTITIDD